MTSGKVALITGGGGFVGSHTVDLLLDRGWTVRVVDNFVGGRESNLAHHSREPRLSVDRRDIRSLKPEDAIFAGADIVIHYAGIGDIVPSIDHPAEYMSVNVQGTVNVMEGARAAKVGRVVYAASSSCYGLAATPTREDHPIDCRYPYALSKYLGEQAVLHWGQVYRMSVNSIRIFNAYGTRSRTSGAYGAVFGVFLRQKLAGQPLTVVGDGAQTRDFVYVTDVAEAFIAAALSEASGQIFNVGAGQPQSVNRIVELLGGEKVFIPKRPGEPDCTHADISKIVSMLGWRPAVSFEDGVGKIVERIEDWREAPLWTVEKIEDATKGWFAALGADRH